MSRQTTPGHRHPQLRKWPVSAISDKRYTDEGAIELQAEWEPTIVRSSQVSTDEDNVVRAEFEGDRISGVRRHFRSGLHPETGEELSTVEWKPSWRSVWALAGAQDVIADYHDQHPEDVRRKEGEWWRRSDLGPSIMVAEGEAGPGKALNLNGHHLVPEKGDYTLTVASHFFGELNGLASAASVRYLNMPVRQRLIFSDQYLETFRTGKKRGINLRTNLRLMLVYVTGLARATDMCSRCEEGNGPFPKCVIDDSVAMGVCVNCAISVSESSNCEFWHHNRRSLRPSVWNPAGLATAEEDEEQDQENDDELHVDGDFGVAPGAQSAEGNRNSSPGLFVTPEPEDGLDVSPKIGHGSRGQPGRSIITNTSRSSVTAGRAERSSRYATPVSRASPNLDRVVKPAKVSEVQLKVESPVTRDSGKGSKAPRSSRPKRQKRSITWIAKHKACTSTHFGRPCQDQAVGGSRAGTDEPVLVHRGRAFKYAEATPEEIDDILSYCPCDQAEEFERMWQVYVDMVKEEQTSIEEVLSKEECLSKVWYQELNQAVKLFCPAPGQLRPGAPECIELD
ncbi:hypothetical protein Slin15195_G114440 [Septoria linicola]|uniref:Uncharacterized protein n=1 Tax=Septoria linicola TaxID=215465 RepID=A0A9Q9EPI0_9PEZI|nr:hypothetical protein Slin15195_G114440 [Septoria linicola]